MNQTGRGDSAPSIAIILSQLADYNREFVETQQSPRSQALSVASQIVFTDVESQNSLRSMTEDYGTYRSMLLEHGSSQEEVDAPSRLKTVPMPFTWTLLFCCYATCFFLQYGHHSQSGWVSFLHLIHGIGLPHKCQASIVSFMTLSLYCLKGSKNFSILDRVSISLADFPVE